MLGLTWRSATRALSGLLVVIVALFVPVSAASAAASITVDPSTASPGDSVTISGNVPTDGCPASDAAQLTSTSDLFPPDGFGPQATRDATGNFTTSYAIPASTPPGDYSIGVRCGGGNVGITAALHVTAATTTSPTTTTTSPTTTSTTTTSTTTTTRVASSSASASSKKSSSALPWILLAILVVVAAIVAAFLVRRRRTG